MKYSTIIPVFNSYATLERAIESVQKQTNPCSELIIVDDGSTCLKTRAYLDQISKIESNIKVYRKSNGGAATARNLGVSRASNDVVAFLDADDQWVREKMEVQLFHLSQNQDICAIASLYTPLNRPVKNLSPTLTKTITLKHQLLRNHIQTSTFVIYKRSFDSVGGFPLDQTHAEEGDLYFKVLQISPILLVNFELVIYLDGKTIFNATGLSGDINKMQKGEISNLKRLYKRKQIGLLAYISIMCFSYMKFLIRYCRRYS